MGFLLPLLQVALVLGIFGGAMVFLKRYGSRSRGCAAGHVTVLATAPLGRSAQVAVVRIGETTLALGVTDSQVSNLGEVSVPDVETVAVTVSPEGAAPAGGGTGAPGFWARFEAAAKELGPAPKTLVAGAVYLVKAVRRMRGSAAGTETATTAGPVGAAPSGAGFADALARATAPHGAQDAPAPADLQELAAATKAALHAQERATLAVLTPAPVTTLGPGGVA